MSTATTDPTLETLVPNGSAWRNAALVVLGLALLAAAWFVPPLLHLGLTGPTTGSARFAFPGESRVVAIVGLEPHGSGGVTVHAVGDVPGAHVVGAWALEGDAGNPAQPPADGTDSEAYLAQLLGAGGDGALPNTLESGQSATLVVLWQVDDCAQLGTVEPAVRYAGRWGGMHDAQLNAAPFAVPVTGAGGPPCGW